jgi:acetylornithine deacetylase/succinyl-diaminopimelate desuccinylase-like protein
MVSIQSYQEAPGAELALAEFIAGYFAGIGIEARIEAAAPGRPNVVARLTGAGGGKSLLLCGHTDTVPPYAMRDPFVPARDGGWLRGRGAVDMKAGLACMMSALRAIKEGGIRLSGDLAFAGVCDEESRSLGAAALVRDAASLARDSGGRFADGAIVGEPTGLAVCAGHRGLEWLEIRLEGKAVHGGSQERGVSAISAAARLVRLIEDELRPRLAARAHPLLGCATINVGRIAGGTQPSTVPGECVLLVDRRWLPSESYPSVLAEIEAILRGLEASTPGLAARMRAMDVSVMEGGMVHAPLETPRDHPLVLACIDAQSRAPGFPLPRGPSAFPAWSDAGLIAAYAGSAAVVWGPGSLESAHSDEERVEIAQLAPAAKGYALAALAFCGLAP